MATKYSAKHVYWNNVNNCVVDCNLAQSLRSGKQNQLPEYIRRFDSQHEFKVYLELVRMYGTGRIRSQARLDIMPSSTCFPRGKQWKVDFVVTEPDNLDVIYKYVEAKGVVTREFGYIMACLEQYKPLIFNNLFLIFPSVIPKQNKLIKNLSLSPFDKRMMSLNTLKNSRELL